jgi:pilus assembly protein CpaB
VRRLPGSEALSLHRRRALFLGALACVLAALGLASGGGSSTPADAAGVPVVVAARPLTPGQRLVAADLAVRIVPTGPLAAHLFADAAPLVGQRVGIPVEQGAPVVPGAIVRHVAQRDSRDIAVRLDDVAGVPAGDLVDVLGDLYLVAPGTRPSVTPVLEGVQVVDSAADGGRVVATLRVPPSAVSPLILAEAAGSLRLVVRSGSDGAR